MKGWLADMFRTVWAMFYWNARKSFFVLRRRRGQCPCHNPSDSGEPMRTGCEGVIGWQQPARFHRVCPLLRKNDAGLWVCSVPAAQVRPFWGRAFAHAFAVVGIGLLLLVGGIYGGMRSIGYHVKVRQIVWPPAWHEIGEVRADLFIRQARESYTQGRVREAIGSLSIAYELNPHQYQVGMMLAQFYQAGNSSQADRLYRQLMGEHPERRRETARVWFQSLLSRGRLHDIAELAGRQLVSDPEQAAAWTHAVLFATRHRPDDARLQALVANAAIPAVARAVISLDLQTHGLPVDEVRAQLLAAPFAPGFPFDRAHRVEELIRLGFPSDALTMLTASRRELAGRDVARLALAAYAALGEKARLVEEFTALLGSDRAMVGPEVALLAVHLVDYPDADLLKLVAAALLRIPEAPMEPRVESALAVFCAAGVLRDQQTMDGVKKMIAEWFAINPVGLANLELFFLGKSATSKVETLLPNLNPLSLELNYALLDRYLAKSAPPAKVDRRARP